MFRAFAYVLVVTSVLMLGWALFDTDVSHWVTGLPEGMQAFRINHLAAGSLLMLFALFQVNFYKKTPHQDSTGRWFDKVLITFGGLWIAAIFVMFCVYLGDFCSFLDRYFATGSTYSYETDQIASVHLFYMLLLSVLPLISLLFLANVQPAKNTSLPFGITVSMLSYYVLSMALIALVQAITQIPNSSLFAMVHYASSNCIQAILLIFLVRTMLRVCLNLTEHKIWRIILNASVNTFVILMCVSWYWGIGIMLATVAVLAIAVMLIWKFAASFGKRVYARLDAFFA